MTWLARTVALTAVLLATTTVALAQPPPPAEVDDADAAATEAVPSILSGPRPVEASARVDKAVATTGDVITYTITIEHEVGYEIQLPEPGADIAGLRIIDIGRDDPETRDGRTVDRRWYQLRADLVGTYILPPVRARYREGQEGEWQTLATSQIFLEVESVLPTDAEVTDIRDLKPLIVTDRGLPTWVWVLIGALVLAAIIVPILLSRRRRAIVVPPAPAHEIAFAALDALRETDFDDLEAVRDYYFRISEVLRAYIEGVYALNATDLTTEEILVRLADLDQLEQPQRIDLRQFLEHTDRVKFAEHQPSSGEIEQAYEHALGFVEATAPSEPSAGAAP